MRLLDEPLTFKQIQYELDMLKGNLSMIATSKDIYTISKDLAFAVDRINIIAHSRIKQILEEKEQ